MKKITSIFVALLLVAVTAVTAFAAGINSNEQSVLDELNTTVTMKNGEMAIPSEFVNQAESYFNTIDMTAEESADIIAIIKEGKSFLENSGAANIADLTFAQKQELLAYGRKVVGVIGMTMEYDKTTGYLYIYDTEGNVVFEAKPTLNAVAGGSASEGTNTNNSGVIKTTGVEPNFAGFAVVAGVAVLLVAAGSVYFVKVKKEA